MNAQRLRNKLAALALIGGIGAGAHARADDSATSAPRFAVGVAAYQPIDLVRIARMGIKHVRMDRPSPQVMMYARVLDMEVLPIADYGYADLSADGKAMSPPLPQHRAEWARRMMNNWRAMRTPPPRIEVWNEPWLPQFWGGKPNPVEYLELVKAFAREVWSAWPTTVLLVSADTGGGAYPTFRRDLLAADREGFLNDPRIAPTTHNYVEARTPATETSNPCAHDLDRYQCAYDDFVAHGHPDPKVWVTEFGWESDTPSGRTSETAVSEAQQASNTLSALEDFRRSGLVAGAFAFMFKSGDVWNYNFLRPDNSVKPVFDSMRFYMQTLPGGN